MTKAVTNKGTTAMSALVVRPAKLEALVKAMDEIKATLPAGELAEIANINSVCYFLWTLTLPDADPLALYNT